MNNALRVVFVCGVFYGLYIRTYIKRVYGLFREEQNFYRFYAPLYQNYIYI